jgi:hypothetical protein
MLKSDCTKEVQRQFEERKLNQPKMKNVYPTYWMIEGDHRTDIRPEIPMPY